MGRVKATTYDPAGNDIADYQGQVVNSVTNAPGYKTTGGTSWTFSNLTPNYLLSYDLYGCSATRGDFTVTDGTFTPASGSTSTPFGAGWCLLGTVMVSASASQLTVNYQSGTMPAAVCLLQQTSASAYDSDGKLTSTTDALGHVAASTYNSAGQAVAGYQGQVDNTPSVVAAGSPLVAVTLMQSYETYPLNSGTLPYIGQVGGMPAYCAGGIMEGGGFLGTDVEWNGSAYVIWDSGMVFSGSNSTLLGTYSSGSPSFPVTTVSAATSWTFSNLTPNAQSSYDVYVSSNAGLTNRDCVVGVVADGENDPASFATNNDPTAPSLGDGWSLLGTVTVPAGTTSLSVSCGPGFGYTVPTGICLMQQTSATTYDATGNVASTTDALNNTTSYQYDAMGRQLAVVQPVAAGSTSQPVTQSVYDAVGNLVQSIDALGNSTEYHYDALGNQDLVTQPQPATGQPLPQEQTVYDADGNATATIGPLGAVTASAFDPAGNAIAGYQGQIRQGDSESFNNLAPNFQSSYDLYVYTTGQVDTNLHDYTINGQSCKLGAPSDPTAPSLGVGWYYVGNVPLSQSTSSLQISYVGGSPTAPTALCLMQLGTATIYDLDGEPSCLTDSDGNTTSSTYDSFGRVVEDTNPLGSDYYSYDADGSLLQETDRDGRVTTYAYNSLNQVVTETWYQTTMLSITATPTKRSPTTTMPPVRS